MKKNVQLSLSQNDHFEVCDDSRRSRIAIAVAAAILSMSANVNAADTFIDAVLPSYSHVVESGNPGNISLKLNSGDTLLIQPTSSTSQEVSDSVFLIKWKGWATNSVKLNAGLTISQYHLKSEAPNASLLQIGDLTSGAERLGTLNITGSLNVENVASTGNLISLFGPKSGLTATTTKLKVQGIDIKNTTADGALIYARGDTTDQSNRNGRVLIDLGDNDLTISNTEASIGVDLATSSELRAAAIRISDSTFSKFAFRQGLFDDGTIDTGRPSQYFPQSVNIFEIEDGIYLDNITVKDSTNFTGLAFASTILDPSSKIAKVAAVSGLHFDSDTLQSASAIDVTASQLGGDATTGHGIWNFSVADVKFTEGTNPQSFTGIQFVNNKRNSAYTSNVGLTVSDVNWSNSQPITTDIVGINLSGNQLMDTADPRDGDQNMYSTIGVEKVRTEGNVVGIKIQSAQTDSGDIYGESFTALRVDQIQSGKDAVGIHIDELSEVWAESISVSNVTGVNSAVGLISHEDLDVDSLTVANIVAENGSATGVQWQDTYEWSKRPKALSVSGVSGTTATGAHLTGFSLYAYDESPIAIGNVKAKNGSAFGLVLDDGMTVKGSYAMSVSDVASEGGTAVGVLVDASTLQLAKTPVSISVASSEKTGGDVDCAVALYADGGGTDAGATVELGNVQTIQGSVVANSGANVDLSGADAQYSGNFHVANAATLVASVASGKSVTGRIDDYWDLTSKRADLMDKTGENPVDVTASGTATLNLNGGFWNAVDRSFITNLNLGAEGGTVDMTTKGHSSLAVKNLVGNGTFVMRLGKNEKDAQGVVATDMLYVQNMAADSKYTISAQVADSVTSIEDLKDLRFATTNKFTPSGNFTLEFKDQGVLDREFSVQVEDYASGDAQNIAFNGVGDGTGSVKPGADAVDSMFKDQDAMNWYIDVPTEEQPPVDPDPDPDPDVPGPTPSDAGQSLLSLAHSNYWNAVEMDRLHKRMGDAQYGAGETGLWVRVRHDSIGMNSGKGDFTQTRTMSQFGFDHELKADKGRELIGVALDYWESDSDFDGISGQGGTDRLGLTAYGTWLGESGAYVDVTAKWAQLSNDFDIVNSSGNTVSADYDNDVYSLGIESGHKFTPLKDKSWFVEPEVQLQYTHVTGAGYRTSQGSRLEQDSFDSVVTRVGFRLGRTSSESSKTSLYFKADWLREWSGDQDIKAYDATTPKDGADLSVDNKGNWFDVGLGYQAAVSDMTYVYVDGEYSFGNDLVNTWNINAGVRWTF